MSGSPRSNNGSSVTSPSRPTASPAADNSHLQQQQQQQYQQQPMYGMPLSSQPVHTSTAAASSTAASAASTAAAAVPGSSSQPGQQSNFVPTGPYQYQGAYQPANLQQRVNAAVLSLNQMFPTPMSVDGSSYQRGQMPQGSDGSNNSFSFGPAGQGQQTQQGSQAPSLYQLQSADGTGSYIPASANPTKIKTAMPFNVQDFYTWSFEFELLVQTAGFWQLYDGTAPFPSHGSPLQQATFRSASLTACTVLVRNLTPTEQLGIRSFRNSAAPAEAAWLYLQGVHMAKDTVNQSKILTQLSNIQMINGEKVTQYINRARNLRDQLQKCGGYFPDAMFHTVLLAGLGPEWRECRSILRMQAQLSEGALCAALIAEQQDMDLHNARGGKKMVNNTVSFYSNPRYKPVCSFCRKPGHTIDTCWSKDKPSWKRSASKHNKDSSSEAEKPDAEKQNTAKPTTTPAKTQTKAVINCMTSVSTVYDPDAEERIHNRFNTELNSPIPPEVYANLAHTIAGPNTWYLDSCCGQHMCSSETRFIVNQRRLENPVVVTVANNQRLTAHWMGSIVLDSVEEDFSLHLNEVLLVPRLGFNLVSSAQLMKNGITLLGEPGKFTLKYGDKKLGTAVEPNGVFVLNFIPERTTADSDNILSLGPWEHRDDIDYTDDTVPREGVVPTSSTTAAAVMLTFDDQGLNDVENSREYMAAVTSWGDTTNMPTDDGLWGADAPDETTWGETPTERTTRLLAEAEQRVAEMEILDSGRLVGVEPVPAASDQESGELVLAPGEFVDVEVRVPPPNLTRYVAPAFDQIRSDGHHLLLSLFANAEYYLRAQGHKATGETWHTRLGHPSQSTLNNTIKAAVLDKNSLLLPNGLELKPVNRSAPCTICPAANLT
ncbi:unnamed protein product [Closterium sp. NIES-54]